jgi:hypothetical protein
VHVRILNQTCFLAKRAQKQPSVIKSIGAAGSSIF